MNSTFSLAPLETELDEYISPVLNQGQPYDFKNVDQLVAMMTLADKNQGATEVRTATPFISSHPVSLPAGNDQQYGNGFNRSNVDKGVVTMLNNSQQLSPYIDWELYFDPELPNNDLPQTQECQILTADEIHYILYDSPESNPSFCHPMRIDEYCQPSNSLDGQDYLADYNFGSAQIAPCDLRLQTESTLDFELASASLPCESAKKEQDRIPRCSATFNPKDWPLILEPDGRKRRPLLHEFLRQLLDNKKYSHIAEYVDKRKGVFKFQRRHDVADLWKSVKARNSDTKMTYDKLARGIRYYYPSGKMRQSAGRFTFRFGASSGFGTTWVPA